MSRIALITGGAGGIGTATCAALAKEGLTVVVADINEAAARNVVDSLPGAGHRLICLDIREEASIISGFKTVEGETGPVAVLICTAGGTSVTRERRPTIAETTLVDWISADSLNARGTFLCMREYLRHRQAKPVPDGRIVTIASLAAQTAGSPAGVAYTASKAAILGLTRYAAFEAGPLGITVNAISPGSINTPAFRTTVAEQQASMIAGLTPVGRIGEPKDIAETIAFIVSPAASFITGCTLDVNGGRLMR
jgi:3-oxoacyl-[acyl-carrier protein] reductase